MLQEGRRVTKAGNNDTARPLIRRSAIAFRGWLDRLNPSCRNAFAARANHCRPELKSNSCILARLLAHVQDRRDYLGRTEPYWSVLTAPEFRSASIASTKEAFYSTGAADVGLFRAAAERCGVSLPWYGTCFELGCGVGRITPWLRQVFDKVIGADVSPSHLALADHHVRGRGWRNIRLHLLNRLDALDELPHFECFFSLIALQHNPPPLMHWFLGATLRKLRPGGIGFFQVPVSVKDHVFVVSNYLENPPARGEIEVHGLTLAAILDLLRDTGCDLLEIRDHDCLGPYPDWRSKNFLVRKARY